METRFEDGKDIGLDPNTTINLLMYTADRTSIP